MATDLPNSEGIRTSPTREMLAALGPASPTFRRSYDLLSDLFGRVKDEPSVQVRYREWQSYLAIAYGVPVGDEELFIHHTYLATLARLIAFHYLQSGGSSNRAVELAEVISGAYFREQGIYNFVQEDFFTWILCQSIRDEALDSVQRLSGSLEGYDFGLMGQDLLKGLYQELVAPQAEYDSDECCTPDWLAEYILSQDLKLEDEPDRSLLDPACGSGTCLSIAIRLIRQALAQRGKDDFDTLLHIIENVMGVDVHPAAVTVARTNYLLALGDLVRGPHPPLLLPVYLANSIQLPRVSTTAPRRVDDASTQEALTRGDEEPIHIIQTTEPNVAFELPDSVVSDPVQLDWLFHRLSSYLAAASSRTRQEGEGAIQEVLNSLYSYLTSPKRGGLRNLPPLSPFAANVMCRTARTLIDLVLEGKDTVWLDILKNVPAPIFLSRRGFDLMVGNLPRSDIDSTFLARISELYLKVGGRVAALVSGDSHAARAAVDNGLLRTGSSSLVLRLVNAVDDKAMMLSVGASAKVIVGIKQMSLTSG